MCSQELVQAGATLRDPHCSGENERHMWWAKIECEMNSAHSAIRQGTKNVMDEQTEIQNLLSKIEDPSLDHMHSSIDRGVAKDPTHTQLDAMKELKEEILRKHPNTHDTDENTRCVKQTTARKQQNRKHNSNSNRSKPRMITSTNGEQIKCHHSHQFDDEDFKLFTFEQKKTLRKER